MKAMISALSALGLLAAMTTSPPAAAEDAPAANPAKTGNSLTIKHDPIKHAPIKHDPIKHLVKSHAGAAGQSGSSAKAASTGGEEPKTSMSVDPVTGRPSIYLPKAQTKP